MRTRQQDKEERIKQITNCKRRHEQERIYFSILFG